MKYYVKSVNAYRAQNVKALASDLMTRVQFPVLVRGPTQFTFLSVPEVFFPAESGSNAMLPLPHHLPKMRIL
jgi:hypothetical protein